MRYVLAALLVIAAVSPRSGEGKETSERKSDSWRTVAEKPPRVLVEAECSYVELSPYTPRLELMLVFDVKTVIEYDLEFVSRRDDGRILFSVTCMLGENGLPDRGSECVGAKLNLDRLVSGEALSNWDLNPLGKDWNRTQFRVVERNGDVFRLASDVTDDLQQTKQTIVVDLLAGMARYQKRDEIGSKIWRSTAIASCRPVIRRTQSVPSQ